jgi:hypothetical protein
MANYTIPERHIEGFREFFSADSQTREKIISIFSRSLVGQSVGDLSKQLNSELGIELEKAKSIVRAITSLLSVVAKRNLQPKEFIDEIVDTYYTQTKELRQDNESVKKQLAELISISQNYQLTIKARNLAFEREKIIESFRIITDVRPVFDNSEVKEIRGSIIIHNLKIDYTEDGFTHSAMFALDENDLKEFNRLILRTQQKESLLKLSLDKSKLNVIELHNG